MKHAKQTNGNNECYQCDICEAIFVEKENLKLHLSKAHEENKPDISNQIKERYKFHCSICEKVYTRKLHLEEHIMSIHERMKPFTCKT